MIHNRHPLLLAVRDHLLVIAGFLLLVLGPMQLACSPCAADDIADSPHGWTLPGHDDPAGPGDPEACDHCHCTMPGAAAPDSAVQLPAAMISRMLALRAPDRIPDDPSFAPDPPPNRA